MATDDVFVRFPLGRTFESETWGVLLRGQPVTSSDGWTVRAEATVGGVVREWTSAGGPARVVLGTTPVDGVDGVTTLTVQLAHDAAWTADWGPFTADFEVVLERGAGADVERYEVLSGFMRGDSRATDDSAPGVIWS